MSDIEVKDDWTTLLAKEALALRSGQAWADIVDDDDDEDLGGSNEANNQLEHSTTAVNTENNDKPVDYLDDIDLAIPPPQPRASISTSARIYSDDDDDYHPSHDSDNWRVRETNSGAESNNWRVRDPHGVKPVSFASFGNKDRFDDHQQYEDRRNELKNERRLERLEYRKPEHQRVDPEDAPALAKWNTFHLVVAQEELEKEKEKERLKNLYLASRNSAPSSELIKGDTNQQICINSNESQKIVHENQSKLDPESAPINTISENKEKQPRASEGIENKLPPNDKVHEKEVLNNEQPIADSLNLAKPHSLEKEVGVSNENEAVHNKGNISDMRSKESEEEDNMVTKVEEKREPVKEDVLPLLEKKKVKDEYQEMVSSEESQVEKKYSVSNEKETVLVNEEVKSKTSVEQDQVEKNNLDINDQESSIPVVESEEANQLIKNEAVDEAISVDTDHKIVPSEEVESDKNSSLAQTEETIPQENPPADNALPSEQLTATPVTQDGESDKPTSQNTIEIAQKQLHSEQDKYSVESNISKGLMEKEGECKKDKDMEKESEQEKNEKIKSEKDQLEATTDNQVSKPSNKEDNLEKGDSLQEIKKEYADLETQSTKESEISEIVGVQEGERKEEEHHENLQSEDMNVKNSHLENNKSILDNVQNDTILNKNDNSTTDENEKMSNSHTTNSEDVGWSQEPIKKSNQTGTAGWGETPKKEEAGWGNVIRWNQEPAKEIKKDSSEESTKEGDAKGWGNQFNQVDSQTESNNNTSWNQEVVKDNKLDNSNGWDQEPTKQRGETNRDHNQNSNNIESESSHNWGTVGETQSPKVEAKKPSAGSWRDQINSAPKDDNVGGWKQFATDQAALNTFKETRVESPKPKKAFLPKNVQSSPKLERSWANDSTSWSKKSDITQTTSPSLTQSDTPHAESSSLATNQVSWSSSPKISHTNASCSNTSTPTLRPSNASPRKNSTSSLSSSSSAPNPWAEFSATEQRRSAQSQIESNRSQSQAIPQLQQGHEATQTAPLQQPSQPPVINISLSDFGGVQLEPAREETPRAPIEINLSWNGGDIVIHPPAENPSTVHIPHVVILDDTPQELVVTPKLEHTTLAGNQSNQIHSNQPTGWNKTATTPGSSGHTNRPRIRMDGSQWKLMNKFLNK